MQHYLGCPSLLDSTSFSDAIHRLNPVVWSNIFDESNVISYKDLTEIDFLPKWTDVAVKISILLAIYVPIFVVLRRLFFQKETPMKSLMTYIGFTISLFFLIISINTERFDKTDLSGFIILCSLHWLVVLFMFCNINLGNYYIESKTNLGFVRTTCLAVFFITIGTLYFLFNPAHVKNGPWGRVLLRDRLYTESVLYWTLCGLLWMFNFTSEVWRILRTDVFEIRGENNTYLGKYVKKCGEWVKIPKDLIE